MPQEATALAPLSNSGRPSHSETNVYDDGYLRIEHDNYYVACGGRPLQLPRKEFLIISCLVRNPDRIVSAKAIWRYAWNHQQTAAAAVNAESLHVHIYRLRRRLAPFDLHIETMVGVGYRLLLAREERREGD